MTWRERASEVIGRVIRENPEASGRELRKLLRAAYPFGERRYYPYKVWLEEVRFHLAGRPRPRTRSRPRLESLPGQLELF